MKDELKCSFDIVAHETGHAIGLPHSADSNDVMFPATRTGTLSDRFTGHNITDADMHQLREDLAGILATVWARRRLS